MTDRATTERILMLTPREEEAEVAREALARAGVAVTPCEDVGALCRELRAGAAALLLSEEVLSPRLSGALCAAFPEEARESEPAIVLLASERDPDADGGAPMDALVPFGNVTILEQPIRARTLSMAVSAALARRLSRRERHRASDEALAELRREGELRERFIGVLAHDLRSPVSAIRTTAEHLSRGALPQRAHDGVRRIERASARIAGMVEDLLDVTRSRQGGGIPVAPAPADLLAICRHVTDEIQATTPDRTIELSAADDTRALLDEGRMAQVVSNLVGNAIAHGPPDAPVRVDLRRDDDHLLLSVNNRGAPIPPERIPALFTPFNRGAHGAEADHSPSGLGLGLFIVDRIVAAHGGRVDVTSTEETGTTFLVKLPAPPAAAAAAEHAGAEEGPASPAEPLRAERSTILIVEDDEDVRETVHGVLEDEGYDVLDAANGREGLDVLASGARPCVVLLDLMMPVMNGWQMLEALRADQELSGIPVVVVSACGNTTSPPPGARCFVPKPLQVATLLAAVGRHCRTPCHACDA